MGARLTPQFPVTTVVTPWLTLADMSGEDSSNRSSWVCASINPGAAIFPPASISRSAFAPSSLPTRAILPARTPISPSYRGARVPSIMTALRMMRS